MLLEVVYHWSRPPPPWSHLHGFSDLQQGWPTWEIHHHFMGAQTIPLQAGEWGCIFFWFFSFMSLNFNGNTLKSWWISTSVVAGLTRSSPRICTTAQFRGARPWVDFGEKSLLDFFLRNQCPVNFVQTCIFVIHTNYQQKNQSTPKKLRFNPQLWIHAGFHGSIGGWSFFLGKKPYHFSAPQPLWHP